MNHALSDLSKWQMAKTWVSRLVIQSGNDNLSTIALKFASRRIKKYRSFVQAIYFTNLILESCRYWAAKNGYFGDGDEER